MVTCPQNGILLVYTVLEKVSWKVLHKQYIIHPLLNMEQPNCVKSCLLVEIYNQTMQLHFLCQIYVGTIVIIIWFCWDLSADFQILGPWGFVIVFDILRLELNWRLFIYSKTQFSSFKQTISQPQGPIRINNKGHNRFPIYTWFSTCPITPTRTK